MRSALQDRHFGDCLSGSISTRLIDVHHHFAPSFYLAEARNQFIAVGNGAAQVMKSEKSEAKAELQWAQTNARVWG